MNRNKSIFSLILAVAMSTGVGMAGPERFPWLTDLGEARELAAAKKMPLLVVFRCEP